jgi:glycosyltransferase involved in cell wall biosynthesis
VRHVHVHFGTNAAAVARLIGKLSAGRIGYSMTIHGPDELDAPIGFSLAQKIAEARFTVAISWFAKAQLQRWCAPEHWERIHVVGCAVDESFLGAAQPVAAGSRTLVSVGRLSPQKGQLLLIEAFARLVVEHPDARLVLCGDGELRPLVEAAIRRHGIGASVEITGWIGEAEVRARLLAARALVLPSFAEGLPVVIMEALALGRPVISTYVAAIPELVATSGERRSGWLVPAGQVEPLVAAMSEALRADAGELSRLGAHGAAEVRRTHHLATEVERLEALLRAASEPSLAHR